MELKEIIQDVLNEISAKEQERLKHAAPAEQPQYLQSQALAQGEKDPSSTAPAQDLRHVFGLSHMAQNKEPSSVDLELCKVPPLAQDLNTSRQEAQEQAQGFEAGQDSMKEQLIKDLALLARPVSASVPASHAHQSQNDEAVFLQELRSRLLVLFEGLRSKDLVFVEEKVDLIINFLELMLAKIEHRLDNVNAK